MRQEAVGKGEAKLTWTMDHRIIWQEDTRHQEYNDVQYYMSDPWYSTAWPYVVVQNEKINPTGNNLQIFLVKDIFTRSKTPPPFPPLVRKV